MQKFIKNKTLFISISIAFILFFQSFFALKSLIFISKTLYYFKKIL